MRKYEYLLRLDGSIVDTQVSTFDLELAEGKGLVLGGEYHNVEAITFYIDFDLDKKVYIVDIKHIPFDNLYHTLQTKLVWDKGDKY